MLRPQFPHIPRKITASFLWYTEKMTLWSMLAAFLMVNLYGRANLLPPYWLSLTAALGAPGSLPLHESYAQALWKEGLLAEAQRELLYAETLTKGTGSERVLGTSWENEPSKLASELLYWQEVIKTKPDYRDGYIALASLAYQLGKNDEAKTYLNQALALDPDNTEVQKLLGILGK